MAENPAPPLNDVDYFNYFKSKTQKDGRAYDEFCESWKNCDIKSFDRITHHNTVEVYKYMVNKRSEHLERYKSLSIATKEKDQKIKAQNQKLEAFNKESMENTKLKNRIEELEDLWKRKPDDRQVAELKEQIKELKADIENKRSSIQRYREQRDSDENQLKENRENLIKADAEIKQLKNANRKLEDDLIAAYEEANEQQSQITNEQLQKALKCSTEENEKLKDDLLAAQNAMNELKDGKTTALNEFAKSLKDCKNFKKPVTKTLPLKKELMERLDVLEAENTLLKEKNEEFQLGLNENANQYRLLFDQNLQLKTDLAAAKKRRKRLDERIEGSRKRSKDREQQNGNGEGSKQARHDEIHPTIISPLAAQQFPISCSPPDLSPQTSRQGPQSCNNGFQQSHPNLMNRMAQPPTNLPFQTFFPAQMHPNFIQQQMMWMMQQQQQQQQQNGFNPPPASGNPSMPNNSRQQQQQLPSPNSIPEMFPPNLNHFQNQQIRTGQMFFRNFQLQQIPSGFMHPPPPQQQNNSR